MKKVKLKLKWKIIFSIILAIILLLLYMRFIANSGLSIREYKVKNSNLSSFYGLKIVHFTDLHYGMSVNDKKLTVSIATKSLTSILIHTGINIDSTGAPVNACGLENDLGISDVKTFAEEIMKNYMEELEDIVLASTKVRGV